MIDGKRMTWSIRNCLIALLMMMLLPAGLAQAASQTADTVYRNGFVYTVDGPLSRAQAFAVKDGKYIVVGTNDDMKSVTGDGTEVVDLKGRMVMPGLVDTHIHALRGALTALGVLFPVSSSVEDIQTAIKKHIADKKLKKVTGSRAPSGPWTTRP